ncbi:hypothetical protein ANTPLA_LOCUS8974 [Anthophora plagiata]
MPPILQREAAHSTASQVSRASNLHHHFTIRGKEKSQGSLQYSEHRIPHLTTTDGKDLKGVVANFKSSQRYLQCYNRHRSTLPKRIKHSN